jgi:hypothetical protein
VTFSLTLSIAYVSVIITASQRMISFLLKRLGTHSLNQVSELRCAACHDLEGCDCLVDVKEASVIVGRGFVVDVPLR